MQMRKIDLSLIMILIVVVVPLFAQSSAQQQTQVLDPAKQQSQGQVTGQQGQTTGQQVQSVGQSQPVQQPAQTSGQYVYNTDYDSKEKEYNATIGLVNYLTAVNEKNAGIKGLYFWAFHNTYGGLYFGFKDDTLVTTAHYESLSFGYVYPIKKNYLFVYGGVSYVKTRVFPSFYIPGFTSVGYSEDTQYTADIGVNIYYKWIGIFCGIELKNSYYNDKNVFYLGISIRGF